MVLFGLMFIFRLIEDVFRIRFEAMWMLLGIIAFLGGVWAGVFSVIYMGRLVNKYYPKKCDTIY